MGREYWMPLLHRCTEAFRMHSNIYFVYEYTPLDSTEANALYPKHQSILNAQTIPLASINTYLLATV